MCSTAGDGYRICLKFRRAHVMLSPTPIALLPLGEPYLPLAARQSSGAAALPSTGPTQKGLPGPHEQYWA
jgi:hypothetical protein